MFLFFSGLTFSKQAAENSGNNYIDSTFRQSPSGFAAHFHGFAAKTKALAREILLTTQASLHLPEVNYHLYSGELDKCRDWKRSLFGGRVEEKAEAPE